MALADIEALPFHSLDDDSFNLEIFESNNGPINFNTDRLMSLNYNLCLRMQINISPSLTMRFLISISKVI
jgi:hypothetical protein